MSADALIFALPPVPHYGGYPLDQAKYFRRAKSEWLFAAHSGPLGPGCAKISIGAVPILRLPVPNQRSDSVFRPHPPASQWSDLLVGVAHWAARVSLRPPLAALKVNYPVGAREGAGPWAPFCPGAQAGLQNRRKKERPCARRFSRTACFSDENGLSARPVPQFYRGAGLIFSLAAATRSGRWKACLFHTDVRPRRTVRACCAHGKTG